MSKQFEFVPYKEVKVMHNDGIFTLWFLYGPLFVEIRIRRKNCTILNLYHLRLIFDVLSLIFTN